MSEQLMTLRLHQSHLQGQIAECLEREIILYNKRKRLEEELQRINEQLTELEKPTGESEVGNK